jgi:hypothetical protein
VWTGDTRDTRPVTNGASDANASGASGSGATKPAVPAESPRPQPDIAGAGGTHKLMSIDCRNACRPPELTLPLKSRNEINKIEVYDEASKQVALWLGGDLHLRAKEISAMKTYIRLIYSIGVVAKKPSGLEFPHWHRKRAVVHTNPGIQDRCVGRSLRGPHSPPLNVQHRKVSQRSDHQI